MSSSSDTKTILLTGGAHDGRTIEVTKPFFLKLITSHLDEKGWWEDTYEACWTTPDCDVYALESTKWLGS